MPKNNPKIHISPPSRRLRPARRDGGGAEPPPVSDQAFLIDLSNLNLPSLVGLQIGEPVAFRSERGSLVVYTALGTRIGDVSQTGLDKLENREVRHSRVFAVKAAPPQCTIEVIL
jgi:hypothetical protein